MLLNPIDMAHFALAYLILAVVPGYAVARLARPHAHPIEHLAFAVPCAYALIALSGLATALAHLPFDLPEYGAVAVSVTLAAALAAWRNPRRQRDDGDGIGRWWLLPAGVAVAQLGAAACIYASDTLPVGYDVLAHVAWTDAVARAHVFPIAMLSTHLGSGDGSFYPPVFHVLAALIMHLTPMATYRAVFYNVAAATIPLPLGLFAYTRAATGSARLGALAALASLAFEPLPFFTQVVGTYTFLASFPLIPTLAVALREGLGEGKPRSVALAALLGVGLFYTHPTEFVTAGLLTLAITPGLLHNVRSWLRAAGYGLIVALAWLLAAAPALAAVRSTMVNGAQVEINSTHDFSRPSQIHLGSVLDIYQQWIFGRNVSYLLLIAAIAGVAWCLLHRRFLGLVAIQAVLCLVVVDVNTYNALHRFYVLSFPWALWERLAPTHYWFVLPLAAIGLDAAVRAGGRILHGKQLAFMALAAAPFLLLGLLLPFDVAAARTAAYTHARKIVAPADFGAIAWLARHAPKGAVVVNDGDIKHMADFDAPIDAGRWMPLLGGPQPLIWRWASGPGPLSDRLYLLSHVAEAPLPPRAAQFVTRYDVRYVFYGAGVRPGAQRHLNLARLLADPRLRLVYASAATCRPDGSHTPPRCPHTGAYVFAIDHPNGV